MKQLIALAVLLSASIASIAQRSHHNLECVVKFAAPQENCVQIPSSFADRHLQQKLQLDIPAKQQITQIDLVYTRFKANPKFNQQQLNNARIAQLKKAYPEIAAANPRWNWIEQTGATSVEEASQYFHGFVVHYAQPADFHALKSYFNDQGNRPKQFTVDNRKGADLSFPSGSVIHVPANCVSHKNGDPVAGNYTIEYTEYRNAAEIVFSGLPMTYKDNSGEFNFNSVGMYEIRGTQNGKDLQLNQPITIDFNCTEVAQGVGFYELDDQTGDWKKKENISFDQPNEPLKATFQKAAPAPAREKPRMNPAEERALVDQGKLEIETAHSNAQSVSTFSDAAWVLYLALKQDEPDFIKGAVIKEDPLKKQVVVTRDMADVLTQKTFGKQQVPALHHGSFKNNMGNTLLAEGSSDPGHTYPALVRGLNSPSFGVYNCDQIFQLSDQISVRPKYVDQNSGDEITDGHVACVVNLNVNGSFSFSPATISCSQSADQVILLFTKKKEVYALSAQKWKELEAKTKVDVTLEMDNITDRVQTSDDLKKYLGI